MLSRLMVNRESRLGRQTSPLSAPGITREMMSRLDCLLIIPVLKSLLEVLLMTPLRSLLDVLLAIFLLGTLTDPLLLPCYLELNLTDVTNNPIQYLEILAANCIVSSS